MDLDHIKRVGIRAAYRSAEQLHNRLGHIQHITKKGAIDLVTEADTESEKIIVDTIRQDFPDHTILAEESGLKTGQADCRWVIDPLDGTTNFAHQLPIFAVSIAFLHKDTPTVGIVMNPESGEVFSAVRGRGASLNDRPIRVSEQAVLGDALLVTGFPYNLRTKMPSLMARFEKCLMAARAVRRLGSAALDLCYVACGRFEGFWEEGLQPWDTAAGALIAMEAGARVTDFSDRPYTLDGKEILATNSRIHEDMMALLELRETR